MTKENNTPGNLSYLLVTKQITYAQYYFRQGAQEMNINTYKQQ